MGSQVRDAADAADTARSKVETLARAAAPHIALTDAAEKDLHKAEHDASVKRIKDRLDRLTLEPPSRTIGCGMEIEPPGLGR